MSEEQAKPEKPGTKPETTNEKKEKPAKREYRLEYKLSENGVPVGDVKNISVKADSELEARRVAVKQLGFSVHFTGNSARKSI